MLDADGRAALALSGRRGRNVAAICRLSGSGILAIIAEAALRAGDFEDVMREIDGCDALNQSPPHLIPSRSIPQSRDVKRAPLPSKRKPGTF